MKDFDWELLHELYKNPNLTKVANVLYITQPTLTKRLQHIEAEFDVTIVERTPKGLEFTPEGKYLAEQAEVYLRFLKQTRSHLEQMRENGGEIVNTCSIAAFAPNTRMAVYCSTKAYVLSLSKALRAELRPRGINVLAVCPGPMDTEFLPVAGIAPGSSHTFDTLPRVNPAVMAKKSLEASARKKGVYTNLLFYKFYRVIAKLLPHSIVMKMCGA